jgi:hypothetical protein
MFKSFSKLFYPLKSTLWCLGYTLFTHPRFLFKKESDIAFSVFVLVSHYVEWPNLFSYGRLSSERLWPEETYGVDGEGVDALRQNI